MKKTILILSIGFGSGHHHATAAIRRSCEDQLAECDTRVVDVTPLLPPWFRWFYVELYLWVLKSFPSLWRRFERVQRTQASTIPAWINRQIARRIHREIGGRKIAAVVSTEAGVNEIAAVLKSLFYPDTPLIAVLTDYDVDRAWIREEVTTYAAGSAEVVQELVTLGAPPSKVALTGIPVDRRFDRSDAGPPNARWNVGSSPSPRIVLAGGGEGFVVAEQILLTLDEIASKGTVEVLVGRNHKLHRRLLDFSSLRRLHLQVHGWIEDMPEFLQTCDLLISKPGGVSLTEAMAAGIPILACFPLPGSEVKHCALVEKWRIGLAASTLEEFKSKAHDLISNEALRKEFSENARRLYREQHVHPVVEHIRQSLGLAPTPQEQLRREFNGWAESGRGEQMEEHHHWIALRTIEQMQIEPTDRVLDLGCGTGWASRRMAARMTRGEVMGVDISDAMIDRARSHPQNPPGVSFRVGGAESLPFPEHRFDKVFSCESFYYYPDLRKALREIHRVLSSGGKFYCLVNLFKENPYTHIWVDLLSVKAHLLGAREYEMLFREAGFREVHSSLIPDETPVQDGEFKPGWGIETIEDLKKFRAIGALLVVGTRKEKG